MELTNLKIAPVGKTLTLAATVSIFAFGSPGLGAFDPSCGDAFATGGCSYGPLDIQTDSDSDGVYDCQDSCPGQSGPASNGGCPEASWWRTIMNMVGQVWTSMNTMLGFFYGMFSGMVAAISNNNAFTISYGGGSMRFTNSDLPFMHGETKAVTIGNTTHYRTGSLSRARSRCIVLEHEAWHVRQYQRWGPLFLPVYAATSLVEGYDNWMERAAQRAALAACGQ